MHTAWRYWHYRGAGGKLYFGCQIFSSQKNNGNPFFGEPLMIPPPICRAPHISRDKVPWLYSSFFFPTEIPFRFSQTANYLKILFFFPVVTCFPEGKGLVLCQPNRSAQTIRQQCTHCIWPPKSNLFVNGKEKVRLSVLFPAASLYTYHALMHFWRKNS